MTHRKNQHDGSRADCRVTYVMTVCIRQRGGDETEEQADHDPATASGCVTWCWAKDTYSKTLEYSSLRAANTWMTMSRQPRGKATSESMKEPLKETLQMDAEQKPPMRISCHNLYSCGLRIRSSRAIDASLTEMSSWMTFQYSAYASWSLPMSSALAWRMNLMLLVLVVASSNEMSITSGRYMQLSGMSSTLPVAWIWACSRCVGPPNIIIARASFRMNSCRCTISATCRVICTGDERNQHCERHS